MIKRISKRVREFPGGGLQCPRSPQMFGLTTKRPQIEQLRHLETQSSNKKLVAEENTWEKTWE